MDAGQQLRKPSWPRRIIRWAIIIELTWLVLVNGLLALPLTQDIVNWIRPEKLFISWQRAWSPWPGKVYARNVYGNGNSRSQIWEFQVDRVSGSIALLPLIAKRVWVRGVRGENVVYRQRPRLKPDRDYSAIEPWFPEITGRQVTPAITGPYKSRRPWNISLRDVRVTGDHDYWIFNVRGSARGAAAADMDYVSRGGPLELDVDGIDLELGHHTISGDHDLFQHGRLSGELGFLPFRPRENRGVRMLDYLLLDAECNIEADDLSFINLFLLNFEDISVAGNGLVTGRLHFDQGWVQPGTALDIDAENLVARVMEFIIEGDGRIDLDMQESTDRNMALLLTFDDLSARYRTDDAPSLTGQGLSMEVGGNGKLLPDPENPNPSRSIRLTLDELAVPDLALLQRFLPSSWPLRLVGGSGRLDGSGLLTTREYQLDLQLLSEQADVSLHDFRFDTDIDAALRFHNPDVIKNRTRADGSYIALSNSRLKRDDQAASNPWSAHLKITEGKFGLFQKQQRQQNEDVIDLFALFRETDFPDLVGNSSGELAFEAAVSSLAWLGVFLDSHYDTRISGSSQFEGFAALEAGLPREGTWMALEADDLGVNFLDYIARGQGRIRLDITEGGEHPDWRVAIDLDDAVMKRSDYDGEPYVQDVDLQLDALVRDVNFDFDRKREFDLSLAIPSARFTDLTVFNEDLPADGPIRILSGEADLSAQVLLQAENADGYLRLLAPDTVFLVDDQEVEAALELNLDIAGGVPRDRLFDFRGSDIVLDKVRVRGPERDFDSEEWFARLVLTRADLLMSRPVGLDLEAELDISDSRPFVTLFDNQGWRPEFLTRAMTVEGIEGEALLELYDRRLLIPSSRLTGGEIEVAAKAVIEGEQNQGMIYARYGKLDALLRFDNGRRNLDLINVTEKLERYRPGESEP